MTKADDYPPIPDAPWLCWKCGDLAPLNESGLCRQCQPDRVWTFAELAARALTGEVVEVRRRWWIG